MLQILSAVAAATYGAAVGVSPYAIGLDKGSYPGYSAMTLADLKDPAFMTYFNSNGGIPDLGESMQGCCVFSVGTDGYIQAAGTFYTAYTAAGTRECAATLAAPVYFGGAAQDGTPNSEKFFGTTLTAKLIDSTTAVPSYTTLNGCESAANAWGLFKSGSGPAPPSPGPPPPPSPGPPGPPQCTVDPGKRTDCGFSKTESECEAAGCCYQTSDPSTFRCYDAGTPDVCQQIDPGKRIDCGYTDTKEQCEAAGCCYDGDTPFTFHCFCKNAAPPAPPSPGPAPPSPPPPSPGPPPPPPPSPGPPSGAPYGDPAKGPCNAGEKAVQINGINGKYCAPSCSTSAPCPAVPAPATAAAQCVVSDPNPPPSLCAVICVPGADFLKAGDGGCMTGASCQAIQGTGVCTYPDSNPTTFAFNLSLDLSVDHAEV